MSERVQLGWRLPVRVWARFERFVQQKHGAVAPYLRFEVECAMREFLDEDDLLADAEDLLRGYTDLRGLSSSPAPSGTDRYHGTETKKVGNRINAALKERFQVFADKHEASTYGRLMAAALDAYMDGGRARRILDDVERLVTDGGTTRGTTGTAEENPGHAPDESSSASQRGPTGGTIPGETASAEENPDAIGDSVDAQTLIDIATALPNDVIPRTVLDHTIADTAGVGHAEVIDAYREAALKQINAHPHPHEDGVYVTDEYREHSDIYADMDRSGRVDLLRERAAIDAVEQETRYKTYTYREVQDVFENNAGGGAPSHQYSYDLMEDAADAAGYEVRKFGQQIKLRVDLQEVAPPIRQTALDADGRESLADLAVDADVTSYSVGSAPSQEVAADD